MFKTNLLNLKYISSLISYSVAAAGTKVRKKKELLTALLYT